MFVESLEAVSTGVSAIELSGKLFPTMKKLFNRLKNGELKIAIFGAGGTGKSTLGKLLSGKFQLSDLGENYKESYTIEEYQLEGNIVGSVIVAPGQERRQDNWDDLLRMISGGKIQLIINVVSWGYHSLRELSYTNHELYQQGMSVETFVQEYAKAYQKRELEVLRTLEPHLSIANQKKTVFITLVTKQDLWWNHRDQVKQHYENGDYEQIIQRICNKRGAANFTHEYRSASLVLENLISGTNELLIPTTAGYDQRLKYANFSKFITTIEDLFKVSLNVKEV